MGILTTEVIPHYSFDLHSLIISDAEHCFMCLLAICVLFGEMSSAHFLIELFFLILSCMSCVFWKFSPCWLRHLQIFSPVL